MLAKIVQIEQKAKGKTVFLFEVKIVPQFFGGLKIIHYICSRSRKDLLWQKGGTARLASVS
jgi:hypothetical protein